MEGVRTVEGSAIGDWGLKIQKTNHNLEALNRDPGRSFQKSREGTNIADLKTRHRWIGGRSQRFHLLCVFNIQSWTLESLLCNLRKMAVKKHWSESEKERYRCSEGSSYRILIWSFKVVNMGKGIRRLSELLEETQSKELTEVVLWKEFSVAIQDSMTRSVILNLKRRYVFTLNSFKSMVKAQEIDAFLCMVSLVETSFTDLKLIFEISLICGIDNRRKLLPLEIVFWLIGSAVHREKTRGSCALYLDDRLVVYWFSTVVCFGVLRAPTGFQNFSSSLSRDGLFAANVEAALASKRLGSIEQVLGLPPSTAIFGFFGAQSSDQFRADMRSVVFFLVLYLYILLPPCFGYFLFSFFFHFASGLYKLPLI